MEWIMIDDVSLSRPVRRRPGILASLMHWWRIRRDAHYLLGLGDVALQDIGLHRGEIEAAVRGKLRR